MKHIIGFALFCAALFLCRCDTPVSPDNSSREEPNPQPSGETTWVSFVNNNDFAVSIYSDYSRLTKIAEAQAQSQSASIETEPNAKGASFYPTCHIVIEGITIPYQMDAVVDKIDSGKSEEQPNIISIPYLGELSSEKKTRPLSASAYIKIENAGNSSLTLRQGSSELKPEDADSTIISGGSTVTYIVTPGSAAGGFTLSKNTTDPVRIPEHVTEFSGGRLYSFVFDGAYLTLRADKPLTIAQIIADKYEDIPPAAPGKPYVVSGMNQLTVKWTASDGAVSYEVFINDTPSTPDAPQQTTETTGTVIFHLENSRTYYVWIRSVNSIGKSDYSPYAEGIPSVPTVAPTEPSKPALKAGNGELTVSWQLVELASAYEVWYGTSEDSALAVKYRADIPGYTTKVSLTGLKNDTQYYVWIKAKNNVGTSGWSPSENAAPNGLAGFPLTPALPTVTQEDGNILVTWPEAEGALSYELWTGTSDNAEAAQRYGDDISGTSVIIGSPADGSVIYFWLKSKNNIGVSGFSEEASMVSIAKASPPTISAGNERLTITWTAIAGADEYKIFYGTEEYPLAATVKTIPAFTVSVRLEGLVNGTAYNVWICGKNRSGHGAMSASVSGKPLGEMGDITVTPGNEQLTVTWPSVPGADIYEVYYNTINTIPEAPAMTVLTVSAVIDDLVNGTEYYIWVKANSAIGTAGTRLSARGIPIATAGSPMLAAGNECLTVTWTALMGADEYEVLYGTESSPLAAATKTITTSAMTVTIDGLTNGTTYNIWIRGRNQSGHGEMSTVASGKPLGKIGGITVASGNERLTITWTAVGADEYEVYYNTVNTIPAEPEKTVSTTSTVIEGLVNGTTYYVWIKANSAIGTGGTSKSATGKPIANANLPTLTAGNGSLTVTWAAIAGADEYEIFCGTGENPPATATKNSYYSTTTITDLINGTVYKVWVRGKNTSGTGAISASASSKPLANAVITAVTAGNNQLAVSWTAAEGADEYEVYYNTANTMPNDPHETLSATNLTLTGLVNGTTYYIWVRSKNTYGRGAYIYVNGKPIADANPPTLTTGSGSLTVTWAAIAGADEYEIFYGTGENPPATATQTVRSPYSTITGLINGTVYKVWIRGKNTSGTGAISVSASSKPLANAVITAVTAGNNQLAVTWTAAEGANEYEVYYNTANTMPNDPHETLSATNLTLTGLVNGTTYYIWVRSKNTYGTGNASRATGKPIADANLPTLATSGNGSLTVTWAAIAGADEYEIFCGTGENPPATATKNSYYSTTTITGLINGTVYKVWVRGKNASGIGAISESASSKPLAEVSDITVTAGNSQLTVTWTAAEGADEYEVYYDTVSTIPAEPIETVSTTNAVIDGLVNGTTYNIWVKSKNDYGRGNAIWSVNGRPIADADPPTLTAGNGSLTVTWAAIAGANEYEIFYGTGENPPATAAQTLSSYYSTTTITGLTNGTVYNVWIRGKNYSGTGAISTSASAKPLSSDVGSLTIVSGNKQLLVSWTAVTGADEYEVYYNTGSTMPTEPEKIVSTTSAVIDGLVNGTTYYIWVKSKNTSGTGGTSKSATGKPIADADPPTLTAGNGSLTVTWAVIAGADEYEIFYGTGENPPATAAQTVRSYYSTTTITGLTNGTVYNVWIRGKNTSGSGAISASASAKPLSSVGYVTIVPGNKQLVVSWTAVAGADEYEVYYSTTRSMPAEPIKTVTTTSAVIDGLVNGTTYYIAVKSKNDYGTGALFVNDERGTPIADAYPPTLAMSGSGSLTVTWTAIPGANEYEVFYGTEENPPATAAQIVSSYSTTITTTITGLTNGTVYNVWIRGKNASGTGAISDSASSKPLAEVSDITVTAENSQLTVTWTAVTGADVYEVYYRTIDSIPTEPEKTVSTTSAVIDGLVNGTTYYIWVRPKNIYGTGKASWSVNGRPIADI